MVGARGLPTVSRIFRTFMLALLSGVWIACSACAGQDAQAGRGLYRFDRKDMVRLLSASGYTQEQCGYSKYFGWDVTKNSDGTALRFLADRTGIAFSVSCDGSVRHIRLPDDEALRGRREWVSDDTLAVIDKQDRVTLFSSEASEAKKSSPPPGGATPFFLWFSPWKSEIRSVDAPAATVVRLEDVRTLASLFVAGGGVVVTAGGHSRDVLNVKVFSGRKDGTGLELLVDVSVERPQDSPAPFYALDVSPWSNEILLNDTKDFPCRSNLYIFNWESEKLRYVGKTFYDGFHGFFLECNLVGRVAEE